MSYWKDDGLFKPKLDFFKAANTQIIKKKKYTDLKQDTGSDSVVKSL